MTGPGVVQQQDHPTYRRSIDELFSITSSCLAELMATQQAKGAPNKAIFIPFYQSFLDLFMQTSKSKIMEGEEELIDEINQWMNPDNRITENRVKKGKQLFMRWGRALEHHGIHTFTK